MTQDTYEFILAALNSEFNQLMASKMYIQHQLSINPDFRVMQETEQEAEDVIQQLNPQIRKYATAIGQLQDIKNLLVDIQ